MTDSRLATTRRINDEFLKDVPESNDIVQIKRSGRLRLTSPPQGWISGHLSIGLNSKPSPQALNFSQSKWSGIWTTSPKPILMMNLWTSPHGCLKTQVSWKNEQQIPVIISLHVLKRWINQLTQSEAIKLKTEKIFLSWRNFNFLLHCT